MSTVQPPTDARTPDWAETTEREEGFLMHRGAPVKRNDTVVQLERFDVEDEIGHVGSLNVAAWILSDGDVAILSLPVRQALELRDSLSLLLERDLGW